MSNKSKKTKFPTEELNSFYDMLERAGLKKDDKAAGILMAAQLAGGMPYIETEDIPVRAQFKRSREIEGASVLDRFISSFIPRTKPDTLNISGDYFGGHTNPIDDYLAEISHSIQYNKPGQIRELLDLAASKERRASGEGVYGIEGTMEHDAHSIYETKLAKSLVNVIEKDYPGWKPKLKPWKEKLEKYPNLPDEKEKYGGHASLLLELIKSGSEQTFNNVMYNFWDKIGNEEKKEKWLRKYWGLKD